MQVVANKGRVPKKTVKRARDLMPGTHRLLLAAARYRRGPCKVPSGGTMQPTI